MKGWISDTETLSRSPSCIETRAKPEVTASWIPACLKSLRVRYSAPTATHKTSGHAAFARKFQHDVPVPPLDAAATRTSTSDP